MNELFDIYSQYIQPQIQAMGYRLDWKEVILGLATPIFFMAFFIEMMVLRKRKGIFNFKEVLTNFGLGFAYQGVEVLLHFLFIGALMHLLSEYAFFTIELTVVNLILGFFLLEFFYYWYHRFNHRVRYFWCSHVVHHSSEGMNMSTATRQSMTYAISGGVILFFLPLILIGYPPEVVLTFYAVDLFYQYFIHTQAVGKLPAPIEYFFNTPSHHRAHHGRNPNYIDKNYGGVVIIFDRWFGTFVEEDAVNDPVDYGIVKPLRSNNIFTINFHEWRDMFKNVMRPGPLSQRLKHLWAPPEWERDSSN